MRTTAAGTPGKTGTPAPAPGATDVYDDAEDDDMLIRIEKKDVWKRFIILGADIYPKRLIPRTVGTSHCSSTEFLGFEYSNSKHIGNTVTLWQPTADTFDEICSADPPAPRSIFFRFGVLCPFVSTLRLGLDPNYVAKSSEAFQPSSQISRKKGVRSVCGRFCDGWNGPKPNLNFRFTREFGFFPSLT